MNAREKIFTALKGRCGRPEGVPSFEGEPMRFPDLPAAFAEALAAAGGEAVESDDVSAETVAGHFTFEGRIVDTRDTAEVADVRQTGLVIVEAAFGVAENGAVWIDPKARYPRELLTLAENVAVVLKKDAIIPTMHEAYGRLDFSGISYALFMAGPSKTADIEQSLVIGAQGPRSLTVLLVDALNF